MPQLSSSASAIIGVDGGFECLNHHWVLLPEVLEGNNTRRQQYMKEIEKQMVASSASATIENLSHHLVLLPEALEGNNI